MTVIADFRVPAEAFALGEVLEVRPGVRVRLESMIPTGEAVIPYFWVRSPDVEAVEAALRDAEIVEDATVVDTVGDETLFRVTWAEGIDGVVDALTRSDAAVLDGEGHGDHWTFQLRFPDYEDLTSFYRQVTRNEVPLEVEGIHDPIDATGEQETGLTDQQREALALALERGYFAVPREATLVDLADELGISDSAVSQRLRRGLSKVLASTLVDSG